MNAKTKKLFKTRLFGEFARIGKAFSSPHRLQLIEVLAQGPRTVEQLADDLRLPLANVSQHLQVLRAAGMVSIRREGLYAHYSLADPQVFRVWHAMRELGRARLAEIDPAAVVLDCSPPGVLAFRPLRRKKLLAQGDFYFRDNVRQKTDKGGLPLVGHTCAATPARGREQH